MLGVGIPLAVLLLVLGVRILLAVPRGVLGVGIPVADRNLGGGIALAVPVALRVGIALGVLHFGIRVVLAVPVALRVGVALHLLHLRGIHRLHLRGIHLPLLVLHLRWIHVRRIHLRGIHLRRILHLARGELLGEVVDVLGGLVHLVLAALEGVRGALHALVQVAAHGLVRVGDRFEVLGGEQVVEAAAELVLVAEEVVGLRGRGRRHLLLRAVLLLGAQARLVGGAVGLAAGLLGIGAGALQGRGGLRLLRERADEVVDLVAELGGFARELALLLGELLGGALLLLLAEGLLALGEIVEAVRELLRLLALLGERVLLVLERLLGGLHGLLGALGGLHVLLAHLLGEIVDRLGGGGEQLRGALLGGGGALHLLVHVLARAGGSGERGEVVRGEQVVEAAGELVVVLVRRGRSLAVRTVGGGLFLGRVLLVLDAEAGLLGGVAGAVAGGVGLAAGVGHDVRGAVERAGRERAHEGADLAGELLGLAGEGLLGGDEALGVERRGRIELRGRLGESGARLGRGGVLPERGGGVLERLLLPRERGIALGEVLGLLALLGERVGGHLVLLLLELVQQRLLLLLPGLLLLLGHLLLAELLGEHLLLVGQLGHLLGGLELLLELLALLLEVLGGVGGAVELLEELVDLLDALLGLGGDRLVGLLVGGLERLLEQVLRVLGEGGHVAVLHLADHLVGLVLGLGDGLLGLGELLGGLLGAVGELLAAGLARELHRVAEVLLEAVRLGLGLLAGLLDALGAERLRGAVEADDDRGRERVVRAAERGRQVVAGAEAELRAGPGRGRERGEADLVRTRADGRHGAGGRGLEQAQVAPGAGVDLGLEHRRGDAEVVLERVGDRDGAVRGQREGEVGGRDELDRGRLVLEHGDRVGGGRVGEAVVVEELDLEEAGVVGRDGELPRDWRAVRLLRGEEAAVREDEPAVDRAVARAVRLDADRGARAGDGGDVERALVERLGRGAGVGRVGERDGRLRERGRGQRDDAVGARHSAAADDVVRERLVDRRDRVAVVADARAVLLARGALGHALGRLARGAVDRAAAHVGLAGEAAHDRQVDRVGLALEHILVLPRGHAQVVRPHVVDLRGGHDGAREEAPHVVRPHEEQHGEHEHRRGGEEEAGLHGPDRELAARRETAHVRFGGALHDVEQQLGALAHGLRHREQLDHGREALLQLGVVALEQRGEARGRELLGERLHERLARDERHGAHADRPEDPAHRVARERDHVVHGHADEDRDERGGEHGEEAAQEEDAADARRGGAQLARDLARQRGERDVRDAVARERGARGLPSKAWEVHGGAF